MNSLTPYLFGFGANLTFGTASIIFSKFAKSHSPAWINQLKASVGFACFVLAFFIFETYAKQPPAGVGLLLLSGLSGLCIGDIFLFKAFTTLGVARTLVLFSFEPLLIGIYGFAFLGQTLNGHQAFAIFFMIACVLTFVLESNKMKGKADLRSFSWAFLGILLDATGIMCTRQAYEISPNLGSFQVNATRALGAMIGFLIISPSSYKFLAKDLKKMRNKDLRLAIGACVFGTFLALALYLHALKTAHVATLTAIAITGPIWVSLIEHIRQKEWPNRYLWSAFALFLAGFTTMVKGLHP